MLQALMDGRALTAGELATAAGVAPQTASGHLGQLTGAGLLAVTQQGRHRYHRLATPQVARMLESLTLVAAGTMVRRTHTGPRDQSLRRARTCYDHIAGQLGVAIADAMAANGWVELQEEAGLITRDGTRFLTSLGIELTPAPRRAAATPLCKLCLDWSERRPHLAGRLGAALCSQCLDRGWVRRRPRSRALDITASGTRTFREVFRIPTLDGALACVATPTPGSAP
jgi:hypothetical protein